MMAEQMVASMESLKVGKMERRREEKSVVNLADRMAGRSVGPWAANLVEKTVGQTVVPKVVVKVESKAVSSAELWVVE